MRPLSEVRQGARPVRPSAPIVIWSPRSLLRWSSIERRRFAEMDALRRGTIRPRASRLSLWFPPRQLLLRGMGRTAVLHLAPRRQVAVALLALLGLAGILLTVLTAARDHRAAGRMASEMASLLSTARIESRHAQEDRELLARLGRELSRRSAELDRAAATAVTDGRTLAEQKSDIERLVAEREAAIDHAIAERGRVARERDIALAERDAALAERDAAQAANRDVLSKLDAETRNTIAEIERIITATGLDAARVVKLPVVRARAAPRGGPFVAWREPAALDSSPEMQRLRDVAPDLARLRALGEVLARLPIGGPLARVDVVDGFGFRIDPLSGRAALHEGVDLSAARGAPVRATAAGQVAFAGWHSEYGIIVEIDHGFGLTTRYAHLSRTLVKVGQSVTLHQEIGLVGDSGRATGVHLHYEVRVNGQARNPVTFLRASRHVREADLRHPETIPVAAGNLDRR